MKNTVFQEILKPISLDLINKYANLFNFNYSDETFKASEHLRTIVYVHLNQIRSFRELEVSINNQLLGFSTKICRSTWSNANKSAKQIAFF